MLIRELVTYFAEFDDLSVVIGWNRRLNSLDPLHGKCGGFGHVREKEGGKEGGEREEKSAFVINRSSSSCPQNIGTTHVLSHVILFIELKRFVDLIGLLTLTPVGGGNYIAKVTWNWVFWRWIHFLLQSDNWLNEAVWLEHSSFTSLSRLWAANLG